LAATANTTATNVTIGSEANLTASRDESLLNSYLSGLAACRNFACLRAGHAAVANSSSGVRFKYNFPHFLIVGWQKTASTALYR
jgi:hypothetical protein